LLDGLEAVELRLSEVLEDNITFRFDSGYFKKEYLRAYLYLKSKEYSLNREISLIKSGTTPKDRDETLKEGTILLKTTDIRNNILSDEKDNFFYINEYINKKMKSTQLKSGDVLMNIVGATTDVVGRTSLILENFPSGNITQAMAFSRIVSKDFISEYLFILLQTYYGQIQVKRLARPTGQYNLNLDEVGRFIIPKVDINFQSKIETLVKSSYQKLQQSKTLYKQSEEILLKELDLLDFEPSKENIAIKSFSESFGSSGRLDSEYYLPMYDEVLNKIENYKGGFKKLEYFSENYSTGYPFKSDSYVKNGTYLIRINNIKKGYLDISNASKIPNDDIELSEKDIAKENDILISMSGTIGNSCKIPKGIEAVINQRIMRITPKNIGFELLPLLINSVIGQNQLERIGTGGVQTNISSSDILSILIPIIDINIQTQIEEKIKESFKLKEESKRLLEVAKRAVEMAIEEGEDMGMGFIKDEVDL